MTSTDDIIPPGPAEPTEDGTRSADSRAPADGASADPEARAMETGLSAVPRSTAEEIEALRKDRDGLADQLLRRRAEFENFRRRTERERQSWAAEAEAAMVKELIPAIDHLEQALKSGADDRSLRDGLDLILRDLLASLAKQGLVVHDPVGQPFDPLTDHALVHEESVDVADGTVQETYRRGYLYKDRLLRPALVRVAKAPAGLEPASQAATPSAGPGGGGGASPGGGDEVD
jgi:molecular chaperone GrpE